MIKWIMIGWIWSGIVWASIEHPSVEQVFLRVAIGSFLSYIAYREKITE